VISKKFDFEEFNELELELENENDEIMVEISNHL